MNNHRDVKNVTGIYLPQPIADYFTEVVEDKMETDKQIVMLQAISGYTLQDLTDMLLVGYTLTPPEQCPSV